MFSKIKKIVFFTILSLTALFTGCTGGSTNAIPFDPEHPYANIEWETIKNIDELSGTWISEDDKLIFPKTIQNKDYLHLINNPTDDSTAWNNYISKNNLTVQQAWNKRFAAISEVYGVNYPLSDENGTEKGVKVTLQNQYSNTVGKFQSTLEMLIPETIVDKNLSFFMLSPDKKLLKVSGIFRFYSSKFENISIDEKIYKIEEIITEGEEN